MGLFSAWFGKAAPTEPVLAPPCGQVAPKAPKPRQAEFLKLVEQDDDMDAKLATSRAYLQLMIAEGNAGDWEQAELFRDYEALCMAAEVATMSIRKFGPALLALGCRRRQEDVIRKGKRTRPYIVRIPKGLKAADGNVVPWPDMLPSGNKGRVKPGIRAESSRTGT
jgi:hypothetical protein